MAQASAKRRAAPKVGPARVALSQWSVGVAVAATLCLVFVTTLLDSLVVALGDTTALFTVQSLMVLLITVQLLFVLFGFKISQPKETHARTYVWAVLIMSIFMLTISWMATMTIGAILYAILILLSIYALVE